MSAFKNMRRLFMLCLVLVAVVIKGANGEDSVENDLEESEGRTFGHHFLKRISFAMIPIMYKLGMMTTLMITLTIMSTKGLAVGVLLLVLAFSQIIARSYPAPAPLALTAPQPAVYPYVQQVPIVHKAVQPAVHVHSAHYQPYAAGWHGKEIYNPYARQDTEETEFENTHK